MKAIHFKWDNTKSIANEKKHGISFQEAFTVFSDELAIEFYDNKHSD